MAVVVFVRMGLDTFDLWPYDYRVSSSLALYANWLIYGGQWLAIGLWGLTIVVLNPIIEEVAFRFGLLRWLTERTKSSAAAVFGSSLVFGAMHLGTWPIWHPQPAVAVNAGWLFLLSLVIGAITVRRGGRLDVAIAAHVTLNALIFILVLIVGAGAGHP